MLILLYLVLLRSMADIELVRKDGSRAFDASCYETIFKFLVSVLVRDNFIPVFRHVFHFYESTPNFKTSKHIPFIEMVA